VHSGKIFSVTGKAARGRASSGWVADRTARLEPTPAREDIPVPFQLAGVPTHLESTVTALIPRFGT